MIALLNLNELLPQSRELVDKMRDSLGILVFGLAHLLETDMVTDELLLTRVWHKAETKVDQEGHLWFNKACASERVATVIQDPRKAQTKQSSTNNKWYAYLGGGAVDSEQTELLSGLVIITKNWQWAALTVVASWFLSCSCECGELSWPNKARIITTEAWEEPVDPLDGGGEEKGTAEPAAGDGVQQPRQQKPEDLFLEMCERFRTELVGMPRTRPLDTEESRQQMKKWWNAEMLANSGFQRTSDTDEQSQSETEAKAAKGANGGEGQ